MSDKLSWREQEETKEHPIGVFLCSEFNSTPFTNCCHVACLNEEKCPSCGRYVVGWDSHYSNRANIRFSYAYRRPNG